MVFFTVWICYEAPQFEKSKETQTCHSEDTVTYFIMFGIRVCALVQRTILPLPVCILPTLILTKPAKPTWPTNPLNNLPEPTDNADDADNTDNSDNENEDNALMQ